MKKKLLLGALILLTIATAAIPAIAASAAVSRPSGHQTQTAWYSEGPWRPADNAHWCMTVHPMPKTGDPVFAAPCVPHDPWQAWFAWRVLPGDIGAINLQAYPDVFVYQSGFLNWTVKVNGIEHPANEYLINYQGYEKGFLLWNTFPIMLFPIRNQVRFITVPIHLSHGTYTAKWLRGASSDKKSQEWLFNAWHELSPDKLPAFART